MKKQDTPKVNVMETEVSGSNQDKIDEEIMHIYRMMNAMFDIDPATVYEEFAKEGASSTQSKAKK